VARHIVPDEGEDPSVGAVKLDAAQANSVADVRAVECERAG
jgi:hypothetical protein